MPTVLMKSVTCDYRQQTAGLIFSDDPSQGADTGISQRNSYQCEINAVKRILLLTREVFGDFYRFLCLFKSRSGSRNFNGNFAIKVIRVWRYQQPCWMCDICECRLWCSDSVKYRHTIRWVPCYNFCTKKCASVQWTNFNIEFRNILSVC